MLFLFLNGSALTSSKVSFWPSLLVLMKGVVCAYVGYAVASQVSPHQGLHKFAFFYGTIPAGGAPLVFAQQYDPAVVGLVASASLFSVCLAGPVEFITALFMGTGSTALSYVSIHQVCSVVSPASIICSALFLIFSAVSWSEWVFCSRVIGVYGIFSLLYSTLTTLMDWHSWDACQVPGMVYLFSFLQNVLRFLVTYMSYLLVKPSGRFARPLAVLGVVALAFIPPLVVTFPNTLHELCGKFAQPIQREEAVLLAIWNCVCFLMLASITAWGALAVTVTTDTETPQLQMVAGEGFLRASTYSGASPSLRSWPRDSRNAPPGVVVALVIILAMQLLMEIVDAFVFASASDDDEKGFTPMFILVNVLEHGHGCFLLIAIVFTQTFFISIQRIFVRLGACGCVFQGLVEVPSAPPASFAASQQEQRHLDSQLRGSVERRAPFLEAENEEQAFVQSGSFQA